MYPPVNTIWTYCSKHILLGKGFNPHTSVKPAATANVAYQLDKGKLLTFMVILHCGTATSLPHSCMCPGIMAQCWGKTEPLGRKAGPGPLLSSPTARAGASTGSQAAWSHKAEAVAN